MSSGHESTGLLGESFDFKVAGHALPNGAYLLVLEGSIPIVSPTGTWRSFPSVPKLLGGPPKSTSCTLMLRTGTMAKICWSLKHQGDTDEGRNAGPGFRNAARVV